MQLVALTVEITEETSMIMNCISVRASMDAEGKKYKKLTMHFKTKRSLVRKKWTQRRVEQQFSAGKFTFLSCFENEARNQRLFG